MLKAKDMSLLLAYAAFGQDGTLWGTRFALLADGTGRVGITPKCLYHVECEVLEGDRNNLAYTRLLLRLDHLPFIASTRPAPNFLVRGIQYGPFA